VKIHDADADQHLIAKQVYVKELLPPHDVTIKMDQFAQPYEMGTVA
jgi:hypothetical protein